MQKTQWTEPGPPRWSDDLRGGPPVSRCQAGWRLLLASAFAVAALLPRTSEAASTEGAVPKGRVLDTKRVTIDAIPYELVLTKEEIHPSDPPPAPRTMDWERWVEILRLHRLSAASSASSGEQLVVWQVSHLRGSRGSYLRDAAVAAQGRRAFVAYIESVEPWLLLVYAVDLERATPAGVISFVDGPETSCPDVRERSIAGLIGWDDGCRREGVHAIDAVMAGSELVVIVHEEGCRDRLFALDIASKEWRELQRSQAAIPDFSPLTWAENLQASPVASCPFLDSCD